MTTNAQMKLDAIEADRQAQKYVRRAAGVASRQEGRKITPDEMTTATHRRFATACHKAMCDAYRAGFMINTIGRAFKKDPATVLHALRNGGLKEGATPPPPRKSPDYDIAHFISLACRAARVSFGREVLPDDVIGKAITNRMKRYRNEGIRAAYRDGHIYDNIANAFDISAQACRHIVTRSGMKNNAKLDTSESAKYAVGQMKKVIRALQEGKDISGAAIYSGMSQEFVLRVYALAENAGKLDDVMGARVGSPPAHDCVSAYNLSDDLC